MKRFLISIAVLLAFAGTAEADALSSSQKTSLRKAMEAADQNDWDEAETLATQTNNRLAAKILTWRRMMRDADNYSYDEISSFIRENPDWPMQKTLRAKAENMLAKERLISRAEDFFGGKEPETPEGMLILAAAMKDKDSAKAKDYAERGFADANLPSSDIHFYREELSGMLSPDDYSARVTRLLCEEKTSEAENYFSYLPEDAKILARARMAAIEGSGKASSLIETLDAENRNNPALTFDRIKYREDRGDEQGIRELVANLKSAGGCPADLVWPYRRTAIQKFLAARNYRTAYNIASNSGLKEGEDFARSEFLAGWIALKFLKDPQSAYKHFYKLHKGVTFPVSLARASYWAALAAKKNGNPDIANTWLKEAAQYPTTYFGQLAIRELGERLSISESAGEPTAEDTSSFNSRETVAAADMLIEADRSDLAKLFIFEIQNQSKNPAIHKLAARIGVREGRPELSVRAAKNAIRNGVVLLKEGYPMPSGIKLNESEHALVLGLIRQESEFDDKAVSKAGAVGLMQVMPKTAAHICKKSGIPYQPGKLMDIEYNTRLGAEYIGEMLDNHSGNLTLALAAYNAGPGRVQEWLATYGDPRKGNISELDWIEMIPFEETRNYVMRVTENVEVYRYLLKKHSGSSSEPETISTSEDYPSNHIKP